MSASHNASRGQPDGVLSPREFPPPFVPAEDLAALGRLGADEARSWALKRVEEYRRFSMGLLSFYNTLSPIHRLPNEILILIFGSSWRDRKSVSLMRVCRKWHQLVLSTPEFWASALDDFGMDKLMSQDDFRGSSRRDNVLLLLARSAPRPIRWKLGGFQRSVGVDLGPHISRVTSIELRCFALPSPRIEEFHRMLRSGMPRLEKLTVERLEIYGRHFDSLGWERLPNEAVSVLREIVISAGYLPLVAVRSLQSITLLPGGGFPPLESLYALNRCPQLRLFVARGDSLPRALEEDSSNPTVPIVSLPVLQTLSIEHEESAASISKTLSALSFPSSTFLDIENVVERDHHDRISIRALFPPALTTLAVINRIVLDTSGYHFYLLGFKEEERRLRVIYVPDLCDMDGFAEAFRASPITHLEVRGLGWLDADEWRQIFQALPRIMRLSVRSSIAPDKVLSALKPSADGIAVHVPSSPALMELSLTWEMGPLSTLPEGCKNLETYRRADVDEHIAFRCSLVEPVLDARAQRGYSLRTLALCEYTHDYVTERPTLLCRKNDRDSDTLCRLKRFVSGDVVFSSTAGGDA